jgi:hypothetical protein
VTFNNLFEISNESSNDLCLNLGGWPALPKLGDCLRKQHATISV